MTSSLEFRGVKGLHFAHLNIRSLPGKINSLRVLMDDSNIQVFTVSETWLGEAIPDQQVQLKGYQLFRQDRVTETVGGGVCAFIKNHIDVDANSLAEYNLVDKDLEIQWLIIRPPNQKNNNPGYNL